MVSPLDLSLDISLNSTFDLNFGLENFAYNNNNNNTNNDFESFVTDEFVDLILQFFLKQNLSLVGLEDTMKLLNAKKADCLDLPTQKTKIIDLFRKNRDVFQVFYFVKCAICNKSTKIDPDSKQKPVCIYCDSALRKTETNFFVIIPMEQQIRQSVKNNWKCISQFDTSDNCTGGYSDAHDGKILKNLLAEYRDSNVNILSLCMNLDGANKFKSNKMSLWPLQFLQNYLPPSIRFQTRNIIVSGFYYGSTKLNCREYLLPLILELNHLKRNNMIMTIDDLDYTFKPVITHCAVDLPAKSMLQETKQFGSYDGCTYCEIPGELVKVKSHKKKQNKNNAKKNQKEDTYVTYKENKFVRYVEREEPYKLRDENDTLKKMLAAAKTNNKTAVNGIKDVSCLVGLEHFNIVNSFGVEYMHCSLLGVKKRLLNYFLNPNFSKRHFYITNEKKKLLNARILSIKPPDFIVRKPRSMEQRANFKASEYRFLLLYYLPVCLQGIIPNNYVKHVQRLSAAIYILLKENITDEEVDKAERMLNVFVKEHQILFGKEAMVMVVHLLKHISESVRQLGPLWCQSAFPFERNNGYLLKLVRGTSDVLLQASSKYVLAKTLVKRKESIIEIKILLGKKVKYIEKVLSVYNVESCKTLNLSNISLSVHLRIRLEKIIYTSLLYTRPKRSINYFIGLKNETFGMAMFYLEYDEKIFVLMKEFESIDNINHILKVRKTNRILMAPINDIVVKYLYMNIGLNEYIATEPNSYEIE